jgi:hypothetical protein
MSPEARPSRSFLEKGDEPWPYCLLCKATLYDEAKKY